MRIYKNVWSEVSSLLPWVSTVTIKIINLGEGVDFSRSIALPLHADESALDILFIY